MEPNDEITTLHYGTDTRNMSSSPLTGVNEVINLRTPMVIYADHPLRIFSSAPIRVHEAGYDPLTNPGITIQAETPFVITASRRTMICPITDLGVDFARRWSKLPEELKLLILSCNLTSNWPIDRGVHIISSRDTLLCHLRMTPEIAVMAKLIYYTTNSFLLFQRRGRLSSLPSPTVRSSIQHLMIELCYKYWDAEDIQAIVDLDVFRLGFSNLRTLDLVIAWPTYAHYAKGRPLTVDEWIHYLRHRIRHGWLIGHSGQVFFEGPVGLEPALNEDEMKEEIERFLGTLIEFDGDATFFGDMFASDE